MSGARLAASNPPEAGIGRGAPDRVVPARTFLAIGVGLAVLAAIYAATAYEEAGTALLALAAVLGLFCAGYLWLRVRSPADEPEATAEPFLPHASVWPFVVGVGAALVANGLLIGGWFALPGAALLAVGVGGFVRETRARASSD